MNRHRRGPLVVGALLFAIGLAIFLIRGIATLVSVDWLVAMLGNDYLVVASLGLLALFLGLVIVLVRSLYGFEQATPPSTESVPAGTPLGAEIDHVIEDGFDPVEHITGTPRAEVRDRLRRAAIATVMRADGCSMAAATAVVSAGDWTTDESAAAFLADEGPGTLTGRLRDALPGRSRFQQRTADAVTAILDRDRGASR